MDYTYDLAKRIRRAHLGELKLLAPNIGLTFNFGYVVDSISAQNRMTHFFQVAQRKVYGPKFVNQRDREWPIAYGYFESPDANPHYHVLAKIEWPLAEWVEKSGPELWKTVAKRGQLDFKEIYNPDGAWSYWTKRLVTRHGFEERWIYKDTRKVTIGVSETKVGKQSGWLSP
jgi:hypothetical protein